MSLPDLSDEEFAERYPALHRRHRRLTKPPKPEPAPKPTKPKPPRTGMRWTKEEDRYLTENWGIFSLLVLATSLGRSQRAVSHHAQELELGPASLRDGGMSLREFERYSGFSRTKIRNAITRLRMHVSRARVSYPHRRAKTGRVNQKSRTFRLTIDQQEQLLSYLLEHDQKLILAHRIGKMEWRRRDPKHCRSCKSRKKPHMAKGLCTTCYHRERKRAEREVRDAGREGD